MVKLDKVAGSGNDEFYTPDYAIKPILKYIPKGSTVWLPFDTEQSRFKHMLEREGFATVLSHIKDGKDFFSYEPETYDVIISNPPYSLKGEVLDRLFKLNKPFAMLVGVVGLFESQKRFEMFRDNEFEVMYLNRRVAYMKDYGTGHCELNPPFSSVYLCSKLLPKQIVFEEIVKSKVGIT